jgi:thymidylate kinase
MTDIVNSRKNMIDVLFEGAAGAGKSHLLALVGRYLREQGLDVVIQSELTHNADIINEHTTEQLVQELANVKIVLKELRTAKRSS